MKGRRERGAIGMAVIAPIAAAIIGGGVAILGATQIVNLAPSNSDPGPAAQNLTPTDVQYGETAK
ncbi:hypothetical protein ACIB24_18010 [Spongisporangium articulatum]|uniref:DUF2613 domain-containing protein n=1 Tax=Spongisporangium articulatum TaxID=3362603 RepID=A0ABW8AS91_9ACTN